MAELERSAVVIEWITVRIPVGSHVKYGSLLLSERSFFIFRRIHVRLTWASQVAYFFPPLVTKTDTWIRTLVYIKKNIEIWKKDIEHNKTYRAKKKAIKNANISDRRGRKLDVTELLEVRNELASKTIADNYKVHLAKKKLDEMKSLKDIIIEYKVKARRGRPTNLEKEMKENAGKLRPKKS